MEDYLGISHTVSVTLLRLCIYAAMAFYYKSCGAPGSKALFNAALLSRVMKFFQDCWVLLLRLFGDGGVGEDPASQYPMLSSPYRLPSEGVNAEAPGLEIFMQDGPSFRAPNSPPENQFLCDYSAMGARYQPCTSEDDRGCWFKDTQGGEDFNVTTDYEKRWPNGTTRRYALNVTNMQLQPDGVVMPFGMVFNSTYPGPWLQACWGDDVEITVTNHLQFNGTAIHWHGVRQLNTFENDGVNGVTQCPIPPGSSFTYRFKVLQYGSSWYHSHFSLQYANGLLGPITFYGPSSAKYDLAIEPTLVTDWNHDSAFTELYHEYLGPLPPNMTSILLNGIGDYAGIAPGGKRYTKTFVPGKRYLMRIINTSTDTTFVFTIDDHTIEVMSSDFVPIQPYKTRAILVGIGQRYHIVVEAKDFPAGQDLKAENF